MIKRIGLFLLMGLVVLACSTSDDSEVPTDPGGGNGDGTGDTFDRSAMLNNWANNIIMPGYTDFADQLSSLKNAADNFNAAPAQTELNELRTAWLTAYRTWQRVSLFEIGPAEDVNLRTNLNIYPTNTTLIESNIAAGNYNLGLSSNREAKGFPALDYLIHGSADTDEQIIALLSEPAYREYLTDLVQDMIDLTDGVIAQWNGNYKDTFVSNDGASSTASVDRLVNDYIFYFEKFLRAGKMGIPLGVFSGSVLPGNIEAYHNGDVSNILFLEGLDAVQDFFNGRHYNGSGSGESLNSYLNELNSIKDGENLGAVINAQLNSARQEVQGLDLFSKELESSPPTNMLLAYDEVQKVVPLFKVDMVSAMSISIDFVDADGD